MTARLRPPLDARTAHHHQLGRSLRPADPRRRRRRDRRDTESSADRVRAAGYEVWPLADAPAEQRAAVFASIRELPSHEANVRAATEVFAGIDVRAALPGMLDVCAAWRPHVVLAEAAEFAGSLAGAHLGVPDVTAGISLASTEHGVSDVIERALAEVREEHGLDAGAAPAAHFTLAPPLLEDLAAPGTGTFGLRPGLWDVRITRISSR